MDQKRSVGEPGKTLGSVNGGEWRVTITIGNLHIGNAH